jgi:hypothetical protein
LAQALQTLHTPVFLSIIERFSRLLAIVQRLWWRATVLHILNLWAISPIFADRRPVGLVMTGCVVLGFCVDSAGVLRVGLPIYGRLADFPVFFTGYFHHLYPFSKAL